VRVSEVVMSSVVFRRLAITCRPASSIYHGRSFTTSSPLFTETNKSSSGTDTTTPSPDTPRIVTLIPGI
jgi:hypothetical protein